MSLDVVTFGCRLNAAESEVIRREAPARQASTDAVVVNTCAVTGEAVRQARQTIRKLRRERPDAHIVVTGCAAQTEPQTFAAMPEVDRVLGNEEKLSGGKLGRARRAGKVAVGDIMAVRQTRRRIASTASRATPAPSCRCRTAAITAARSASSRSAAAIRARCRWPTWSRRRAGSPRAAIARSC